MNSEFCFTITGGGGGGPKPCAGGKPVVKIAAVPVLVSRRKSRLPAYLLAATCFTCSVAAVGSVLTGILKISRGISTRSDAKNNLVLKRAVFLVICLPTRCLNTSKVLSFFSN